MKDKIFQIKLSHLIIGGILLLLLIFLLKCDPKPIPINTYDKEKREIDSCEYLYGPWGNATILTHKGNCRFCKQRK